MCTIIVHVQIHVQACSSQRDSETPSLCIRVSACLLATSLVLLLQTQYHPNPTYMRKQPDITNAMRSILVDWLVEVSDEFHLDTQTLFLAVSYTDRYLSCVSVMRSKLQLVGTASMYLSSKFEEIYPPDIGEFAYITDDTYTKRQVGPSVRALGAMR